MLNKLHRDAADVISDLRSAMKSAGAPEDVISDILDFTWFIEWNIAEQQRKLSISHKKFHVGASLRWRICDPDYTRFFSTYGYNTKDIENGVPKLCAERRALHAARNFYTHADLTAITIVGPTREGLVLMPCPTCQSVIGHCGHIRPWTLVLGIVAEQDKRDTRELQYLATTWNQVANLPCPD